MTPALLERQRSEQYLTSSQTRAHFLRQENGRPHLTQSLLGRVAFVKRWLFEFTSISRHLDGPAWKALIEEEFGDGIMSAIDFNFDFEREANPKGDRVEITTSGKFLPYKYLRKRTRHPGLRLQRDELSEWVSLCIPALSGEHRDTLRPK